MNTMIRNHQATWHITKATTCTGDIMRMSMKGTKATEAGIIIKTTTPTW
jgi:hypothetical protein